MSGRFNPRAALATAIVCATIAGVMLSTSRTGRSALSVRVSERHVNIGIPGVTKQQAAVLRNRGVWPVLVTACQWVHHTGEAGRTVASAIERWDGETGRWDTIVAFGHEFCDRYPMEMVELRLERVWLWPLQEISAGFDAVAALDALRIGDRARFVLFLGRPGDQHDTIASPAFVIDECRRFHYRPGAWTEVPGRTLLEGTVLDGVDVATEGIEGCFGDIEVAAEMYVSNRTDRSLTLEHAALVSESERHAVAAEAALLHVAPGTSGRALLRWTFESGANSLLGRRPNVILRFRIDGDPVVVPIAYERAF